MNIKSVLRRGRQIALCSKEIYKGFTILKKTKQTPQSSYVAMRKLFVSTNGRSNDIISRLVRKKEYTNLPVDGVLGLKNQSEIDEVVKGINENGFYIFKQKLPADLVDAIYKYAKSTPCNYLDAPNDVKSLEKKAVMFDERNPVSPRYDFTQKQILDCEPLQKLIFDPSLLAVAQSYLKTKPILDLIAMWWSAPFHGAAKSEAAQMYHFDLDRIKFLKFFFYITDVDAETGPHCYVRKSHKRLPASLLKDGRHTDEEVEAAFGKENMLELCGSKGSILAVDTRGLHKGKDLTRDKRLLFQVEFANSMFGQHYPPGKRPALKDEFERQFQQYKYSYQDLIA